MSEREALSVRTVSWSESVFDGEEAAYQQYGETYGQQVEILVDERLDRCAVFPDQPAYQHEAQPRLTIDANTNIGRSSLNTPAVIVISL